MKKSKKRNNSFKRSIKKTKKKGLNRKKKKIQKKSKKVRKLSRKQYGGSMYGLPLQSAPAQEMDRGEPAPQVPEPAPQDSQPTQIVQLNSDLRDEIDTLKEKLRVTESRENDLKRENRQLKMSDQLTEIKRQLEVSKQETEEAIQERDGYLQVIHLQKEELGELYEAREELKETQSNLEEASTWGQQLVEKISENETQIKSFMSLKQENEELVIRLEELESEFKYTKIELERQREFNVLLNEQIERTSSSEEEDNPELQEEERVLRDVNAELNEKNRSLEAGKKALEVKLEEVKSELTEVQNELNDYFNIVENEREKRLVAERQVKEQREKIGRLDYEVSINGEKIVAKENEVNGLQEKNNKLNDDKRKLETKLATIESKAEIIVRERQANSKSKEEIERLRQGFAEIHDLAKQQYVGASEEETDIYSLLNLDEEDTQLLQRIMSVPRAIE